MDALALHAFIKVAEYQSFSQAAQQLHLTQPAVSKRIAGLEETLGCPLFDRIGRNVFLTETGKTLLGKARLIVNEMDNFLAAARQHHNSPITHLSMASSHHIGLHYLGPILQKFTQLNPKVTLDLHFMGSELTTNDLIQRKIEIALTTLPRQPPLGIQSQTIWHEPMQIVVAKHHPLAQLKKTIRLNELIHLPAIIPEPHTTTYNVIKQAFDRHKIPLKRTIHLNYLETIKALISHGLGWSLLPEILIDNQLTVLTIENTQFHRALGVMRLEALTPSRAALQLMTLIEQLYPLPT